IISNPMTLHVLDSPRAAFTFELTGFSADITFTNESENADSFLWSFGDGGESDLEAPAYEYSGEGVYEIMLVAINGCTSDTTYQTLELIIAATEGEFSAFEVYPTVVNDRLTINSKDGNAYEVEIYSLQGNRLMRKKMRNGRSSLSLAGFQEGVYLLNIHSGGKTITRKIVVAR
ncbi:MAG: T9SS type A sorting domain-containing protein, partial [Pseudomonadales bacterium]